MIETLSMLFASSGFGALTGLLGGWLSKREERQVIQLKYSHEEAMAELRSREAIQEAQHELALADKQVQKAQAEGDIAIDIQAGKVFEAGQRNAAKPSGIRWVDAFLSLMRPLITLYLLYVGTTLAIDLHAFVGGLEGLTAPAMIELYKYVIYQIFFLVATAVAWWFQSRPARMNKVIGNGQGLL